VNKKVHIENWDGKPDFDPCSLYMYRQDWLAPKVVEEHRKGTLSEAKYDHVWEEEEWRYQNNLKDMAKVKKLQKDIAVIVPTHRGHRPWMKPCLESHAALGYFVILCYDNPYKLPGMDWASRMPSPDAMYIADMVLMKHVTWHAGVGVPHIWNFLYGVRLAKAMGFKYVFNINGDCILEHPENFPKIIEMLGDADIIACSSVLDQRVPFCGTMGFLAKTEMMDLFWTEYLRKMYHFNIGNAETRLGTFIKNNNYKIVPTAHPKRGFRFPESGNEFFDILGFRHLHAEHKHRKWEKRTPLPKKFYDFGPGNIYIGKNELDILTKFWETGEDQYKEAWWNL